MVISLDLRRYLCLLCKHLLKWMFRGGGMSFPYVLILLFVSFFLPSLPVWGSNHHANFEHIGVEDGLPSSTVYTAFQDSKGYMWFGTEAGLSRFDGYDFTNYTITDNLPANDIFQLKEDTAGRIWILSLGHLSYYYQDSIYQLKYPELEGIRIFSIEFNHQNEICIATKGTIYQLDTAFQIKSYPVLDASIMTLYSGMWIRPHAPTQSIWINFRDSLREVNKKYPPIHLVGSPITGHRKVFMDIIKPDSILYGTKEGLMLYDGNQGSRLLYKPPDKRFNFESISNLLHDNRHNVWLGHLSHGCLRFSPDLKKVEHFFPNIGISHIFKDREGNLWFTSLGDGIYLLPWNQNIVNNYQNPPLLPDNNIQSLLKDYQGKLWLGTKNGYVIRFEPPTSKTYRLSDYANEDYYCRIMDIINLPDSSILLGTDKGLCLYRKGRFLFTDFLIAVKDIDIDKESNEIWIACSNSAVRLHYSYLIDSLFTVEHSSFQADNETHRQHISTKEQVNLIYPSRAFAVCTDKGGTAWIGNNQGLHYYNGDSVIHPVSANKLLNISIAKIQTSTNAPLLWIATQGGGLVIKRGEEVRNINTKNGLAGDMCHDLYLENDSTIWLATNRGVHKIIYQDFDTHDYTITHFDTKDGLLSNAIHDVLVQNDKIYVGTTQGLSIFEEPENTKQSVPPPPVYINRLRINAIDTVLQDHYQLNSIQNDLMIDFVGLYYKNFEDIDYYYRLEGIDADWQHTRATSIRYNSLPAGDYVFKVKAINKLGIESEQVPQFTFSISLPWWRNWWFILGNLLFLFAIAYIILQAVLTARYNRRLKLEVQEKTQQLEKNIIELKRSNEHLQEYAHITSHDLKEPLRSISGFIQLIDYRYKDTVDTEIKEYIGYTITGVKRMESLINALLEYSKVNRKLIELEEVNVDELLHQVTKSLHSLIKRREVRVEIQDLPTIIADRQQLSQLFQNLIQNGIKFNKSPQPSIHISYEEQSQYWTFRVTDNGIGIAKEYQEKIFTLFKRLHTQSEFEGTGTGLSICKRIVERHGGNIGVESEPNKGTTFYFTISKHLKR